MRIFWLLLLVGCFPNPPSSGGNPCVDCHGSPETGPAPPAALGGSTNPSSLGVGAHDAHSEVACSECHVWPDAVDSEGHIDTPWPAEVVWGAVATTDGGATPWDRTTGTCTVYCHGTTLPGASVSEPSWVDDDSGAGSCGSCHGAPPPAPHPDASACGSCHPEPSPATHVNGVVDF